MADSKQNQSTWPNIKTEFRKWTSEEVKEAANYIKKERPDIWQALIEQEEATGDLRELAATRIAGAMLRELHQGVDSIDVDDLFGDVRDVLCEEINHKNSQ